MGRRYIYDRRRRDISARSLKDPEPGQTRHWIQHRPNTFRGTPLSSKKIQVLAAPKEHIVCFLDKHVVPNKLFLIQLVIAVLWMPLTMQLTLCWPVNSGGCSGGAFGSLSQGKRTLSQLRPLNFTTNSYNTQSTGTKSPFNLRWISISGNKRITEVTARLREEAEENQRVRIVWNVIWYYL